MNQNKKKTIFALWGMILIILGFFTYLTGVFFGILRNIFFDTILLREINENIVWYSGVPVVIGTLLVLYDLLVVVRVKRKKKKLINENIKKDKVIVALTAYNDEESIESSVQDFLSHEKVTEVIVVSNNSTDNTLDYAKKAGAKVFNEPNQGYGSCVYRCFEEAIKNDDADLIALCEGDMTFRSYDLEKLLSYISHADIVNGTRIVEQLQNKDNQLSMFMHYGNYFVGKLLELKYLGDITLSDVGTTYKLCRKSMIKKILPKLDKKMNLVFNPYFLEKALINELNIVECPITFHSRVGKSKGGNINNKVALKLGLQMIVGIIFGWRENKNG